MYSNCFCSCSFEPEIIKIGQSSHKMYSNNILNFQESTTILNASIKYGNLLNTPRIALAIFDLVRNATRDGSLFSEWTGFLNFCWPFYSQRSTRKNFGRKIHDWLKKGHFFYCKFIFTFQPGGSTEPTFTATCFIPFVINHHLGNIRLMLPFPTETYTHGVFINSFCWWVGLKCISKSEEIFIYNRKMLEYFQK